MTNSKLQWGVSTDKGLCLVHGFTHPPVKNAYAVTRLCDRTLIPDAPEKLRQLEEGEWPSCKDCRVIYKRMRKDGVRD